MRTIRLAVFAFVAIGLNAQSFEVTSVKVNHSGSNSASFPGLKNGKLTATNAAMKWILQTAYGLSSLQIEGPNWLDTDRFDISAISPPDVPDTAIQPMLQSLLRERFGLVAHIETKEMPVYNLVVAKDGLKIKPYDPNGPPPPRPVQMSGAYGAMAGQATMPELAKGLAASGRPVIDKTGLEGRYAYFLQYGQLGNGPDQAPDIFGAVQQQLGLKLEPAKAPVEMLVVDHIDRTPSEN